MNRAKLRKAVDALPPAMPAPMLEKALTLVRNPKTRQRIRAEYQRAEAKR